jgi:crotonobetainyl-CoA:carnitine CoA-transferase CaiB-like acyl-CoA transferase
VTRRGPDGDGTAEGHSLPLSDVRVLAVEQFGAGPWGTLQLSDLGAEVIKVEDPASRGDVGRYVPPFQEGEDSLFFETFNRNKKSVSLDLRHVGARDVLHDLVRVSDAVYSNLRGDQPGKLGLTYEALKGVNPRIVCCSLSGFGMTGPRAAEGGYDYMMQGLAGWQSLTGEPDGPPTKSGLSLVDLSGGYASAIALLAGLWRARRDGVGCDCDVSLFETALHELMYIGPWAATHGYVPPRMASSAHPSIVPFQNFRARDGWFVVAAAKQKFWERLCEVVGRPELNEDPRFATMAARNENRDVLLPILEHLFSERTVAEWLDLLVPAGVPSAKINSVLEALEDGQTVARGGIVEHEHPSLGTVRTIASPLRLADEAGEDLRAQPPVRGPFRGEHTEQVLVELCGYSQDRVRELHEAGVFGDVALRAGV